MIKWIPSYKTGQNEPLQLQLIPDPDDSQNKKTCFIWEKEDCVRQPIDYCRLLFEFVYSYGGPNAEFQWLRCWPVFKELWCAACKRWDTLV